MTAAADLANELRTLGLAAGLLQSDGSVDESWFAHPLTTLSGVLAAPARRAALRALLGDLLPPADPRVPPLFGPVGAPVDATCYPLLSNATAGNLYLTVQDAGSDALVLGMAGQISGPAASVAGEPPPAACLTVHAPLVSAGGTRSAVVAGSAGHPVTVEARLSIGLNRGSGAPLGLDAARLRLTIPGGSGAAAVAVLLEGLDLGAGPTALTTLDPAHLGVEGTQVVVALLHQALAAAAAPGLDHLLPLLGIGLQPGLPPMPITQIAGDPGAVRRWWGQVVATEGALQAWLSHAAGLLGLTATPAGSGTTDDPWRIPLPIPAPAPAVALTLARQPLAGGGDELQFGITLATPPGARITLAAQLTLLAVPLGGTQPVAALPLVRAYLTAGTADQPLLAAPGADGVGVSQLLAGLAWDGHRIAPVVELHDVTVALTGPATHYDLLDLQHAGAVLGSVAEQALRTGIDQILGPTGTAVTDALLALLGLAGSSAPGGIAVDLTRLAADPTRALGDYHRRLLDAGGGTWLTGRLAALIGVSAAPTPDGKGTPESPWTLRFTPAAATGLGIAVWDASPADPVRRLRVGLTLRCAGAAGQADATVALIGFDLPPDTPGRVTLLGDLHLQLRPTAITPGPVAPSGPAIGIGGVTIDLGWTPGLPPTVAARFADLTVSSGTETVTVPTLDVPAASSAAADLGIGLDPTAQVWPLLRILLGDALARSGPGATALGYLLGLTTTAFGAPPLPTLTPPTGSTDALAVLTDPMTTLRTRLTALVTGALTDGTPLPVALTPLLQSLLTGALTPDTALPAPPTTPGGGSAEDPWVVPLSDAGTADLLFWLHPVPPAAWAAGPVAALGTATDGAAILRAATALRGFVDYLPDALAGVDTATAAVGLDALTGFLNTSDSVVATAKATAPGWAVGAPVPAAHHRLPRHATAVRAIRAQLQAWGAWQQQAAVVLLVGPTTTDHTTWDALLQGLPPGASTVVDLRAAGVATDLTSLPATPFCLLDLAPGDLDSLAAQVATVTAHLAGMGAAVHVVGHGVGALAAIAAAAPPHRVAFASVIALGAPLQPDTAAAAPLTDPACADALRLADRLAAGLASAGRPYAAPTDDPQGDALVDLLAVSDGYTVPATGAAPRPAPYPTSLLQDGAPALLAAATLPQQLLAIPGALPTDHPLPARLGSRLAGAAAGPPPPAPTHVGVGVRVGLAEDGPGPEQDDPVDTATADASTTVTVRVDLGHVPLGGSVAVAPARSVVAEATVERPGWWLVGGPGDGRPVSARCRRARLRLTSIGGAAPALSATLFDTCANGVPASAVGPDDPTFAAVLAAVWQELGTLEYAAEDPGGDTPPDDRPDLDPDWSANALVATLSGLALLVERDDPLDAAPGLSLDAFTAFRADPSGWLARHAADLLDAGGLGFARQPNAPGRPARWTRSAPGLPVELAVSVSPWSATLRTVGNGLDLGGDARLDINAGVAAGSPGPVATADLGIAVGASRLRWQTGSGPATLHLALPPWLPDLTLLPSPPDLRDRLAGVATEALAAAVGSALIDTHLPVGLHVEGLARLIADPAGLLASVFTDATSGVDTTRVAGLLAAAAAAAAAAGLTVAADGTITLPGTGVTGPLTLHVTGTGGGGIVVGLRSATADATATGLTVDLTLHVDRHGHVVPGGTVAVDVALPQPAPPTTGPAWPGVTGALTGLRIAATLPDGGGLADLALTITPVVAGQSPPVLQLLPRFGGFAGIVATATRLLPAVLDAFVARLGASPVLAPALDAVTALGLYGEPGGFAAKADALVALASGLPDRATVAVPALSAAAAQLVTAAGLTGVAVDDGPMLRYTLTPGATTAVTVSVGWPAAGPGITVSVADLAAGPCIVGAAASLATSGGTAVAANLTCSVAVADGTDIGFPFTPALALTATTGAPIAVSFLPLGQGPDGAAVDGFAIDLAPVFNVRGGSAGKIAAVWVEPAITAIAVRRLTPLLTRPLWSAAGAPSLQDVLRAAKLIAVESGRVRALPLPGDPLQILLNALSGLLGLAGSGQSLAIPLSGGPSIAPVAVSVPATATSAAATDYGLALLDRNPAEPVLRWGPFVVTPHFSLPTPTSWTPATPQTRLLLVRDGGGITFAPRLDIAAGVALARADGTAMIDTAVLSLADGTGWFTAAVDLTGGLTTAPGVTGVAGALALDGLGLPLLANDPTNPVAAGLLHPGTGDPAGDKRSRGPTVDLAIWTAPDGVHVRATGAADPVAIGAVGDGKPVVLPVHRSFGPLSVDQIGVGSDGHALDLEIDGGLSLAGLAVDVEGLTISVPLATAGTPATWTLDLQGLAVSIDRPPLQLAGGLFKVSNHGVAEYDGAVQASIAGRGLSAIGAYSHVDGVTSLFVFAVANIALGGPPFFFVEGLAAGVGINRALVVPSDPLAVPTFPLLTAIDTGGTSIRAELDQMRASMPARRGEFWIAAGLAFSTFKLLRTNAVATVTLGGAVTVAILGVTRLQQPKTQPVVNLELAIDARFSTADETLSVLAALTPNSWLLSKDCEVTGGFALIAKFSHPAGFLFTVGGYSTAFTHKNPLPSDIDPLPAVARAGFHWAVSDAVVVKGETYFALLSHAAMVGGRLEVAYSHDPIQASFIAWVDATMLWDPSYFSVDAGIQISVNADLGFTKLSATVGAQVTVAGPPVSGHASLQVGPLSFTVPIGPPHVDPPDDPPWTVFSQNHLPRGATQTCLARGAATAEDSVTAGLGGSTAAPDGSPTHPFVVGPRFVLSVSSLVPVASWSVTCCGAAVTVPPPPGADGTPIEPPVMGAAPGRYAQTVTITGPGHTAEAGAVLADAATSGFPKALWTGGVDKASSDNSDNKMIHAGAGLTLDFRGRVPDAVATTSLDTPEAASQPAKISVPAVAPPQAAPPVPAARAIAAPPRPALRAVLYTDPVRVVDVADHAPSSPHARAFRRRSRRAGDHSADGGIHVRPGSTQVWDVPADQAWVLHGSGTGHVRVVCLSGHGAVLRDDEVPADALDFRTPFGTARVTVTPAAPAAASGWAARQHVLQVGPHTALGRGCAVVLPRQARPGKPMLDVVAAAEFLGTAAAVETQLPTSTAAVAVLLAATDRPPAALGDLAVATGRARVRPPAVVDRGDGLRVAVFPTTGRAPIAVAVASARDWRPVAVLGLPDAADVVRRMAYDPLPDLGPLARSDGDPVRLRLQPVTGVPDAS